MVLLPFIHLSVHPPTHLSIHPPIHPSINPTSHSSIHLSIHLDPFFSLKIESGVIKMAQWVNRLATKSHDLSLIYMVEEEN